LSLLYTVGVVRLWFYVCFAAEERTTRLDRVKSRYREVGKQVRTEAISFHLQAAGALWYSGAKFTTLAEDGLVRPSTRLHLL
jgi:hypothetical protein